MERGTEWEKQAVKETWAAREKQRQQINALLLGTSLLLSGLMIAVLALLYPLEFCIYGDGIDGTRCMTQEINPHSVLITVITGTVMMIGGSHLIWQNTKIQ